MWFSIDMRLFFALCLTASAASACTCVSTNNPSDGVKSDLDSASVVFRGVVTEVKDLPSRPDLHRGRYAVTFHVSKYWKGNPGQEITLHILEPRADCIGAHFDARTEYLVFAKSQKVDDHRLEKSFWYGWLDLMPAGTEILTVNNFCDSTEQAKKAGKALRVLGKGEKPRA
jgi:hypothetical protein